jgi:hypothetical protein
MKSDLTLCVQRNVLDRQGHPPARPRMYTGPDTRFIADPRPCDLKTIAAIHTATRMGKFLRSLNV